MKKTDFNFDIAKAEQIFYKNLNEKDKRFFAALESMRLGYYGVKDISNKYKINKHTVRKGQKELFSEDIVDKSRVRKQGGGRKKK